MIRRQFIRMLGAAGLSSLPVVNMAAESTRQIVHYRIKGFTCITCAVGLDTMLERTSGVVWSKSSYRDSTTTICFHPDMIAEKALKASIAEMGFTAELSGESKG